MRRGRPPHRDILTPREWDVLSLLDEGLTNAQIAERLGVSENTAKYHVAEILSKLDVSDRTAAARLFRSMKPKPQRAIIGIFASASKKVSSPAALRVAGLAAGATAVAVFAAFVIGLLIMSSRSDDSRNSDNNRDSTAPGQPSPTASSSVRESTTGRPELDAIFQQIESRNASALLAAFSFQEQPCTSTPSPGGPPPCRDGEAQGTAVEVFNFRVCEPQWKRQDETLEAVEFLLDMEPTRFAAFTPPAGFQVHGDYVLVVEGEYTFNGATLPRGAALGVDDGMIASIIVACGAGEDGTWLIPTNQSDFLLEPPP